MADKPARVIGVIADVHESSLEQKSSPQVYVPMTQNSDVEGANLIVRSHMEPNRLAANVLAALRSLNPSQPATVISTAEVVCGSLGRASPIPGAARIHLRHPWSAAGGTGHYGVISYSVTQKTQEIGVRMALGATAGRIQRGVLAKTLTLAVIGIGVGAVASLGPCA